MFFIIGFPDVAFLEGAYSTIVNLPDVLPFFIPIAIAFAIGATAFIYFAFLAVDHDKPSVRGLLITAFAAGMILILSPYDKERYWLWLVHTTMGFVIAAVIVFLGMEFGKVDQPREKALGWLRRRLPSLLGIGTAGLFITAGINMLMETYFFVLASFWFVVVGVTVKQAQR